MNAAVFDLDGTLIDSAPDIALALNHALSSWASRSIPLAEVRVMIGDGVRALMMKAFAFHGLSPRPSDLEDAFQRFLAYAANAPANESTVFAGVMPLLHRLRASDVKIGVCTNKIAALATLVIESMGLREVIDVTVGGDGPYPPKPDPSSLLATVSQLGCRPEQTIYIGDMHVDVMTARSAGIRFVGVDHGHWPFHKPDLQGTSVVKGCAGLEQVFQTCGWIR